MVDRRPTTACNSAVSRAFIEHESFLKRFLRKFLSEPQDIEDVVQETFLKAYSAERDREIRSPKAFLFRVARNAALKQLTRRANQITDYIEDLPGSDSIDAEISVEEQVEAREKLGMFCQSALEMSPQVRRVFLMVKVYGMSHKEISAQLGIAVSTVEKHVARGLEVCSAYVLRAEQVGENATEGDEETRTTVGYSG